MTKNVFIIGLLMFIGVFTHSLKAQYSVSQSLITLDVLEQQYWVDSVYQSLSWSERIAQLFMVEIYAGNNSKQIKSLYKLVKNQKIGGLIFIKDDLEQQTKLNSQLQSMTKIPLLVGMDIELGLNMPLNSTLHYPNQLTLRAIANDSLIYQMGADIAYQMKTLGVSLNFVHVADNSAEKSVIGDSYFGEDKYQIANKYIKGLQDHGVLACAKYFSKYDDIRADSRHILPVVNHSTDQLDSIKWHPLSEIVATESTSIINMQGNITAIDSTKDIPDFLSKKSFKNLRKDKITLDGLVIIDAFNMKNATHNFSPGQLEIATLQAGSDLVLSSQNVPLAIKAIRKAMQKHQIKTKDIELHVKKILQAKYKIGMSNHQRISTDNLELKLNRPESEALQYELYQNAITVIKNEEELLPIKILDTSSFASLSLNDRAPLFHQSLAKYSPFSAFSNVENKNPQQLYNQLKDFEVVVIGVFGMNNSPQKNFGIKKEDIEFIETLSKYSKVIVAVFGSPYSLSSFQKFDQVLCSYEDNSFTRSLVPQAIFGAIDVTGRLPISTDSTSFKQTGISLNNLQRLGYALPEMVEMDKATLDKIDLIAREAIESMATPGCQILVAKNGKVIYDKSFGYHTYDSLQKVSFESIYDIASITKVAASLQALIFMHEKGLIDLDKKISFYLTDLKGSNKEDMTIRDILSHQSGLWPYLPFWKETMNSEEHLPEYYNHTLGEEFPHFVADGLYTSKSIRENVWEWVIASKMREKEDDIPYDYKYSDMGYYMMYRLAEKVLNQPLEDFLSQNIYEPLGLATLGYNPLDRFSKNRIVPTENDLTFRMSQVWGTVHDQGAALFGGVAGHAGLFSNANDLAILMQMHLQGGKYGGQQYLSKKILDEFTRQQYDHYNRRGMGWDKPLAGTWYGPASEYASSETYGHTGFTGTAAWVDPTFDLVLIFLSNRIYPDANNSKLIQNNIRTRIQDVVYQSMWEYDKYHY